MPYCGFPLPVISYHTHVSQIVHQINSCANSVHMHALIFFYLPFFPSRAVFPKIEAAMFEKWVYTFGREMIVLSSRHPLVSGFHKLLSICFHTCKLIGYFKVWRGIFVARPGRGSVCCCPIVIVSAL